MFETDLNGRLTAANDAFRQLALGGASLTPGAAPWVNAKPSDRAIAEESWQRSRETHTSFSHEFQLSANDGTTIWVHVATQPIVERGEIIGFMGTATDVTESVAKRVLSERLVGILDSSQDAVIVFDSVGHLQFCNDGARSLIGITDTASHADAAAELFIQAIRDQVPREVITTPTSNRWEGELAFRSPDGIMRTMSIVLQIVRAADGSVSHYSAIARDVTEAKQLQDELSRQATHDALTGLPNRVLLVRKLSEALERCVTTKRGVAVLFIDLDKLKHVNDSVGHSVGDQLITTIAKRIASATRPTDLVARISGDEFVVLCDGLSDEHVAMDVAERVRQAVTGQVILQGMEIVTSASIGIALSTPALLTDEAPADAAVTLLRNADTAMYRAKSRGRGRCELFTEDMRRDARERVALTAELERALASGQLSIVHQPVVSSHTSRVVGTEALLRWHHPLRGTLTPPSFLELAEDSGSIGPIGDWVVRSACRDAQSWITAGHFDRSFRVHVNVSARQLGDAQFVDRTLASVRESGLEPSNLVLEISEKTMLADNPAVTRALSALKRSGVRIAIDDFGTGYSSLAHLRDFPADYLKLDGSLVRDLGQQGGDDPIVRSIIQLAHSLNMSVIAEWVSTDDQSQRLRLLGCDFVQGNRIGEAVAANEFTTSRATSAERRA